MFRVMVMVIQCILWDRPFEDTLEDTVKNFKHMRLD